MTQNIRFPLRLNHTFFKSLEFFRAPELSDQFELHFSVELKVHDENFPERLQIDLKFETPGEQPLKIYAELIAIFNHVEEQPLPNREILSDFINERALHMMWPYMAQMIKLITGQMGTNPINVRIPFQYSFSLEKEDPE